MYSSFVSELVNSSIRQKLYACKDRYFTLYQYYISIQKDIYKSRYIYIYIYIYICVCIYRSLFLAPVKWALLYRCVSSRILFTEWENLKQLKIHLSDRSQNATGRDDIIRESSSRQRPPHIRICTQIKFYLQISWQWFGPCRSAKRWFWWGVILENSPRPRYTTVTSLQNQ